MREKKISSTSFLHCEIDMKEEASRGFSCHREEEGVDIFVADHTN